MDAPSQIHILPLVGVRLTCKVLCSLYKRTFVSEVDIREHGLLWPVPFTNHCSWLRLSPSPLGVVFVGNAAPSIAACELHAPPSLPLVHNL